MEMRHIRYFLMLAEEKSFTRAAARIGIGQPPLSMQIRDLENEIGYPLFNRTAQGVQLTEAGRAFLQEIKPVTTLASDAIASARRAAMGETGILRLGFTGTAGLNPVIPACIRDFGQAFPAVHMKVTEANSLALIDSLLQNQLDIAFIREESSLPAGIDSHRVLQEPLVAALPLAHPLAKARGKVELAALQHDNFILTPQETGTSLRGAAILACRKVGFEPPEGQPAPHIVSILSVVAAGLGVSLVPESMRQLALSGVVFKHLKSPPPMIGLAAAWNASAFSAPASNFLALVKML